MYIDTSITKIYNTSCRTEIDQTYRICSIPQTGIYLYREDACKSYQIWGQRTDN